MRNIPTPLNIFVVEHRGDGGMIHYAYQLCTALANNGGEVTLITSKTYELSNLPHNFKVVPLLKLWPTSDKGIFDRQVNNRILNTVFMVYKKLRRITRGWRYIFEWIRLYQYLVKHKPDIIQFGKIEFKFEAFFLQRLNRKNLTLSQICHEFEAREIKSQTPLEKFFQNQYKDLYHNFSILFFHADNNRQRFQSFYHVPKERLKIIPHGNEGFFSQYGIDPKVEEKLSEIYQLDSDTPLVLFFGLLAPSKGIPNLIEAFSLVHHQNPQARLVIAGSPSKHIDLQNLLKQVDLLGLSQSVYFDSRYIPNHEVGTLMSLARVVVYPYINSTQSGSLQVAYTFGKPVIATNVGGLPEVVDDNRSGFLVPAQNPQALARAILELVNDPIRAKKMGDYAKHLSETRFSWSTIAQTILNFYHEIITQNN